MQIRQSAVFQGGKNRQSATMQKNCSKPLKRFRKEKRIKIHHFKEPRTPADALFLLFKIDLSEHNKSRYKIVILDKFWFYSQ